MAERFFERMGQLVYLAAHRLHVRSALNPMLWLCAIISPIFLTFAYLFRGEDICLWLIIAAFVPVGVTCLAFIGFALLKPEKLQSEDYQIRHESLQIIQQKSGQVTLPPVSIEAIANPATHRIESEGKEA